MLPNVLLVVFDAARRDAFEPYGAPAGSTPTVGQLAARGAALEEVYATGCWTAPSHASIFTGLMPRAAGLSLAPSPAIAKAAMARHRDRLLPEVLRRAGYATGAVTANLWCSKASGFDGGFDDFMEVDPGRHARIDAVGRRDRLRWALEGVRGKADNGARDAAAAFDRWVRGVDGRPFFAFVNLMEAHSPYLPPLPYGGFSPIRRFRVAEEARTYYTLEGISRVCAGDIELPAGVIERAAHNYRAGVRYMDDWLSGRLQRLDEIGRLDDTVVIVISDHGENLGENGLIAHALSLDNRLIHVPFIVAGPDSGDAAAINSLAELPRYVAECAGLERHPWHDGPPPGFGVAQFDPPGAADAEEAMQRLEDVGLTAAADRFITPLTCATAGGLKLLRRGDREELYDLAADPLEVSPLSPDEVGHDRVDAVAALRLALEHPAMRPRAEAEPPAPEATDEADVSDLEQRMKLLGYM